MDKHEQIVNAILAILATIDGISKVYSQIPIIKSIAELKEFALEEDEKKIIIIGFQQVTRTIEDVSESFLQEGRNRTWLFVLYYAYSFENNSSLKVGSLCEEITDAFNEDATLGNVVQSHSKIDVTGNILGRFTNVLCHIVTFEMVTQEIELLT